MMVENVESIMGSIALKRLLALRAEGMVVVPEALDLCKPSNNIQYLLLFSPWTTGPVFRLEEQKWQATSRKCSMKIFRHIYDHLCHRTRFSKAYLHQVVLR